MRETREVDMRFAQAIGQVREEIAKKYIRNTPIFQSMIMFEG